jgi:hypothetical protein
MIYEWAMRLEGKFDRRYDLLRTAPQVMKIDGRSATSHIPTVSHLNAVEGFMAKKNFIRNATFFIDDKKDQSTLLQFLQDALGSEGTNTLKNLEIFPAFREDPKDKAPKGMKK